MNHNSPEQSRKLPHRTVKVDQHAVGEIVLESLSTILSPGMTVVLWCQGFGSHETRFLDGNTDNGNVSVEIDTKLSGTRWAVQDGGNGTIILKCLGTGSGSHQFLDGNTDNGKVSVETDTTLSGTRWEVQDIGNGTVVLECLGTGSGRHRYLDGNTDNGDVNLTTNADPTGTRWSVYSQRAGTPHFDVFFDRSLGDNGSSLADAVLQTCEADYDRMQGFFGFIGIGDLPFQVYIFPGTMGAGHYSCRRTAIYCTAFDGTDADLVRALVTAEEAAVFMANQGVGWDCHASNGQALIRVLATELYPNELTGRAAKWLDSSNPTRPDFVNNTDPDPTGSNRVSSGCGILFINWLRTQLGFTLEQIIKAGQPTLAETYRQLTGRNDGFLRFSALLGNFFPPGQLSGLTSDSPFPLVTPTKLSPGMTVILWCAGSGSGASRFLNGNTENGNVSVETDTTLSGTRWAVQDGGSGTIVLRCLGTGAGSHRYLDGNTDNGNVSVETNTNLSGTRWEIDDGGDGWIILRCMGTGAGSHRYLDGNTDNGNVSVETNTNLSGTRWAIFRG